MNSLHTEIKRKMLNRYGDEKRKELEKYILEKFCLNSEEPIIHEFNGSIRHFIKDFYAISHSGSIFVTNYRILAQGELKYIDYYSSSNSILFNEERIIVREEKKALIRSSVQGDCCGYIFPIKDLFNLVKKKHFITYRVKLNNFGTNIRIKPSY